MNYIGKYSVRGGFGIALALLAGSWNFVSATPSPPPVLCIDGGNCVEVVVNRSYTLDSIGTVPFSYNLPIPPTITSEATVTPDTINYNKVQGRRIILSPGYYGNQNFATQDQEIVFTPGAELGFVGISSTARRLVFRGSPARAGSMKYVDTPPGGGPTDILFDGVTIDHADRQWNKSNLFQMQRLAIINSYIRAQNQAFASFPSSTSGRLEDVVLANNHFYAFGTGSESASAVRFQAPLRLVFVDNRVQNEPASGGDAYHTFRIHGNPLDGSVLVPADYCYVARNQFEGPGHQIQRPQGLGLHTEVINVWYEDNEQYLTWFQPINIGNGIDDYVTNFRIRNNRLYANGQSWPRDVLPAWTVNGNLVEPYRLPPPWQFQ